MAGGTGTIKEGRRAPSPDPRTTEIKSQGKNQNNRFEQQRGEERKGRENHGKEPEKEEMETRQAATSSPRRTRGVGNSRWNPKNQSDRRTGGKEKEGRQSQWGNE